jgi:potassium-transporting ATPase potassium-binding subunit
MTINGLVQIGLYFVVLLALVKPLGLYMARVYEGRPSGLSVVLGPLERRIYRLCGLHSETLAATALASMTDGGRAAIFNPGSHGFSEVLNAYTSIGNNNGSTFGGLNANTPFYNLTGGLAYGDRTLLAGHPHFSARGLFSQKAQRLRQ